MTSDTTNHEKTDYEKGWNDALEAVGEVGDLNNPENMSIPDEEGYEGMFISYKQLGDLEK